KRRFRGIETYAEKRTHRKAGSTAGPGLQLRAGHQVRELHDVGWQEVHRAGDLLRVNEATGEEGRRRGPEAVQEGRGERQAGAGSEESPRGRRQLPGAD